MSDEHDVDVHGNVQVSDDFIAGDQIINQVNVIWAAVVMGVFLIIAVVVGVLLFRSNNQVEQAINSQPNESDASPASPTAISPAPALVIENLPTAIPEIEPTLTLPPSPTPDQTIARALAGVTRNGDWAPNFREFNGVRMLLIPAGCFEMGSAGGNVDELPIHEVCFERPFWIDETEVTTGQFDRFNGSAEYPGSWPAEDQPRDTLTWQEAVAFCERRGAHLPSEAEWEYAAAGPDEWVYPWGNSFLRANAVWGGSSQAPALVGSLPAGASWVGALDMSGNLWEWVADWYDGEYYASLSLSSFNPPGPQTGTQRVMRGGAFDGQGSGDELRAANRDWRYPDVARQNIGFRCAMDFSE